MVVAPPKRQSKKLESVASAIFQLGRKTLQESQFPDEYRKPDGYLLKRPSRWRHVALTRRRTGRMAKGFNTLLLQGSRG
jgi:hypothetical protein